MTIENKFLSSKCRGLLTEYGQILEIIIEEIKKEQDSPISEKTADAIALEYVKRQGVKQGLTLLMQKINSKANVKE